MKLFISLSLCITLFACEMATVNNAPKIVNQVAESVLNLSALNEIDPDLNLFSNDFNNTLGSQTRVNLTGIKPLYVRTVDADLTSFEMLVFGTYKDLQRDVFELGESTSTPLTIKYSATLTQEQTTLSGKIKYTLNDLELTIHCNTLKIFETKDSLSASGSINVQVGSDIFSINYSELLYSGTIDNKVQSGSFTLPNSN